MLKIAGSRKRGGDKQTKPKIRVAAIRDKIFIGFALYYQVQGDELRRPRFTKANHSVNYPVKHPKTTTTAPLYKKCLYCSISAGLVVSI